MAYIQEEYINSFPSTKRASINKLMTENSITRLLNRLIDVTGYVITSEINLPDNFPADLPMTLWEGKPFEFILRGYYFAIDYPANYPSGLSYLAAITSFITRQDPTSDATLYAAIAIDPTNPGYPELYGQDAVEQTPPPFKGIQFVERVSDVEDIPEGYKIYSCPVLQYTAATGAFTVPATSLFKFDTRSIKKIDGGEMTF